MTVETERDKLSRISKKEVDAYAELSDSEFREKVLKNQEEILAAIRFLIRLLTK